ncbi:hypothetical protein PCASD_24779 [Puccinia coronata f. sp. avenae]|uniref:BED-type domain-containing protein n=2 Tax=Puccinia coronata f. sp. avenae TaxID=200324 RepID=A0A2N5S2G9_9BASI|nr:hypothetical protein PCASD_24779 [Puccinia coronata f. sp. avenae]
MPAEESNNDWDDENSTTPSATPGMSDLTDEQRLEHAKKLAHNQVSSAYSSYDPPELSNQLDKFKHRMIAWRCKTCSSTINQPTYKSSCSNLLAHAGRCLRKQQIPSNNKKLAAVGITGTGEIDPQEVLQRCAIWCAEGAKPFLAMEENSLKKVLHPTILKNLPNRKMVSKAIHMLYLSVQEELLHKLNIHKGALYLGVDAWQSPNGFDILGVVIYRLSDNGTGQV